MVNGVGWLVRAVGDRVRIPQTGFVRNYAVTFVAGTIGVVVWLIVAGGGV